MQKSGEELNLSEAEFGHDPVFPVHALTAGASYDILNTAKTKVALGAKFTFFNPDKRLAVLYGDNPTSAEVYIRLYPRAMGRKAGKFYLPY